MPTYNFHFIVPFNEKTALGNLQGKYDIHMNLQAKDTYDVYIVDQSFNLFAECTPITIMHTGFATSDSTDIWFKRMMPNLNEYLMDRDPFKCDLIYLKP